MNKRFSTLLMGAAILGTISASAAVDKGKLHTVKVGDKLLTIEKTEAGADSLALVSLKDEKAVLSAEYQKTLWKFEEVKAGVSKYDKLYKITNYGTGAVLSLDLSKASDKKGAFIAEGQDLWNVENNSIDIKKDGNTYTFKEATINKKNVVTLQKVSNGYSFDIAPATDVEKMSAKQLNGLYNTPFVLSFTKEMEGNPLNGAAVVAEDYKGDMKDKAEGAVMLKFADSNYLVVDTTTWDQTTNKGVNYWKVITDAKPTKSYKATEVYAQSAKILANGRAEGQYAFYVSLNIADGYKVQVTPVWVPNYLPEDVEEGKQKKPAYGLTSLGSTKPLSYGSFAGGATVMAALSVETTNFKPAEAVSGEAEVPEELDTDYTYYVIDKMNGKKNDNKYKDQYFIYNKCNNATHAEAVNDAPGNLWYIAANGRLSNMLHKATVKGGAFITLIDEEAAIYAFGTDTVQLVKGPKVEYVQKNSYKNVSKNDYVNGALSFLLKSDLAEDLYLCNKEGKLFVENSDLASAAKFKVTPVENEEAAQKVIDGSNGIIRYRYTMTDRLGKETLCWNTTGEPEDGVSMQKEKTTGEVWVSFEYLGTENEYKIDVEHGALAAKAGSGIVFLTDLCDTENTTFVFAKKDAPTYGAPEIGHVQITTLEDDGKFIASQKDGFAALKAVGQSLKSDIYTKDTLTMWLDTACVEFDEAMPLYYISTNAFEEKAEGNTRNYLMNTANIFNDKNEQVYDYPVAEEGDLDAVRAAYIAATVCGWDSLAINGKVINKMNLNPAAIAFEVAPEVSDEAYRIVSKMNKPVGEGKNVTYENRDMYLAHLNNVLFWTKDFDKAEIFVINRASTPTANEGVEVSEVTVIAGEGNVTIAGAAGKKVVVSNILGQVVANTVITSDNATIAAPAGVVVVAVEGEEAVKAIIK